MCALPGFDQLPRGAQTLRVARVARLAVGAYLAVPVRVEPLYSGMNTVFRVFGIETGDRFVLRVHPAKWLAPAQVEAEMRWLHALCAEAGLPVPLPVRRLDGTGFTTLVGGAEVAGARCCTMCHWVEGRAMSARLTEQQMRQAGALLARVHEHGRAYTAASPELFDRPRLNCDGIFGPGAFGPIHGDFYYRNMLVRHGTVRAIDFDMCGWGHYSLDLAIPHWPSAIWRRGPDYRAAALIGYRSVREFPEMHERWLPAMLAARRLIDIHCVLARWDHPDMRAAFPESVDWACSLLSKWLDSGEAP